MNRRRGLLGAAVATFGLGSTPTLMAMKMDYMVRTSEAALQTNSEIPAPDFNTLPWKEVMYVGMLATWYDVFRNGLTTFFDGLDSLRGDLDSVPLKAEVVGGIGVWTHLYEDVAEIEPPATFADSHEHFSDALSELDSIARTLSLGVIQGNADMLASSIDGLDSANASLRAFVSSLPYAVPDRRKLVS